MAQYTFQNSVDPSSWPGGKLGCFILDQDMLHRCFRDSDFTAEVIGNAVAAVGALCAVFIGRCDRIEFERRFMQIMPPLIDDVIAAAARMHIYMMAQSSSDPLAGDKVWTAAGADAAFDIAKAVVGKAKGSPPVNEER